MKNYVDHICSITVHVRDGECNAVEELVYDNWDDCVALSFLRLDDSFYELMPYEKIDKAEYDRRIAEMKLFDMSLLSKYEYVESTLEADPGCVNGVCPIR